MDNADNADIRETVDVRRWTFLLARAGSKSPKKSVSEKKFNLDVALASGARYF